MTQEIIFPPEMPEYFFQLLSENRNIDSHDIGRMVDEYLSHAKTSLKLNEFIDIKSASVLADVCHYLISQFDNFSVNEKKYVVAAIYYFVESDDAEHDFESLVGFEDDIKVMNYVLEKIGHTHKKIEN